MNNSENRHGKIGFFFSDDVARFTCGKMLLICNQTCGQQTKLNFHTGAHMFKSKCNKKSSLDLFPKKRKVDSSVGIVKYCQMKIKEKEESRKPCKEKEELGIDCLKYVGPSKPVESDKKDSLTGSFKACKKSEDQSCSNKIEEKPKEKPIIHSSKQPHCPSTLDRLSKEIQEIMARRIKKPELDKKDCKNPSSRSGKDNPLTGCFKVCKKSEDPSCSNKVEEKPIIDSSKQPACPSTLDRLSKEIQEIMARRIKVEEQNKKPELEKKEKDFCKDTVQVKKDDECLRRKVTAKTPPKTKADVTEKKVLEPKHTNKEKAVQPKTQTFDECKELKSIKPAAGQCPELDFKPKEDCVTSKKDTKPKLIRSSSCLKTSQSKDYKPSASTNCKSDSQKTKPHCDHIVETIASKKITECEDESKKCEKLIATLTAGPKGLCQSRDDEAEEPPTVIAKECKCDVTPSAKEPSEKDECQPKPPTNAHESIQKGLKGLTNMLPGSETNELKDMGLLRQCMFLAKENQRTPVTLRKFGNPASVFFFVKFIVTAATDEELNKAMTEGQVFLCQVKKFGNLLLLSIKMRKVTCVSRANGMSTCAAFA